LDKWLIYATGGGIGVDYTTRAIDDCVTGNCGGELTNTTANDFDFGYTIGGGVERMLGCHWSIKIEYLYLSLESQNMHGDTFFVRERSLRQHYSRGSEFQILSAPRATFQNREISLPSQYFAPRTDCLGTYARAYSAALPPRSNAATNYLTLQRFTRKTGL
jgi:hypothetical protein